MSSGAWRDVCGGVLECTDGLRVWVCFDSVWGLQCDVSDVDEWSGHDVEWCAGRCTSTCDVTTVAAILSSLSVM